MNKAKIISIIFCVALGSCSSTVGSKWQCANPDYPDTCVTISEAEGLGNSQKRANKDWEEIGGDYKKLELQDDSPQMKRIPERIGRIWFSSFVDTEGNYHEPSYVRVVDEPSRWEARR